MGLEMLRCAQHDSRQDSGHVSKQVACHPERSEGAPSMGLGMLRFAQHDSQDSAQVSKRAACHPERSEGSRAVCSL
jgi:hypothetical protein